MSKADALAQASEAGVDLVCISPGADPPVCKIIDYGRFRFQLEKKKKAQKKASVTQALKEIKLSYTIESHDFNVRVRAAEKFLTQGNKVRAHARPRPPRPPRPPHTRLTRRAPRVGVARCAQVKAVVQFRGREMQHTALGADLLQRLSEQLSDIGSPDGPPKQSGNRMEMYITPKPKSK